MELVCPECEVSTEDEAIVVCVGCKRKFHAECVAEASGTQGWRCEACTLQIQRCHTCKKFTLNEFLRKCRGCAAFVCASCPDDCGGHACATCGKAVFWRCVRCPLAFCRGCRPEASLLITARVIKCVAHIQQLLPPLDPAILKRRKKRLLTKDEPAPKKLPKKPEAVRKRPDPVVVPKLHHVPVRKGLKDGLKAMLQARRASDDNEPVGLGLPDFGSSTADDDLDVVQEDTRPYNWRPPNANPPPNKQRPRDPNAVLAAFEALGY